MAEAREAAAITESATDLHRGGGGEPVFLPAARASARLAEILKAVDQLNVIAINAQLVVARSGEEGEGFGVISGQLEAFARETPALIHQIHRETVVMIRQLSKVHRTEQAHAGFVRARGKANALAAAGEPDNLDGALAVDRQRLAEVRQRARSNLDRLESLVGEVMHKLEGASHLALNARVESAKAPAFRHQFTSVAHDVGEVVARIQGVIAEVQTEIKQVEARGDLKESAR